MADQNPPQIILDPALTQQPLRPVPLASATPAAKAANASQDRRSQVQAELEKLQQEESSLLNNIKDWLTKVQGAETKQQALERELFDLDRGGATSSPANLAQERAAKLAALTEQLQQAQAKVKEITKQQKIDEKKAFDNYSAGGLDRQGLLKEMEVISERYAGQLADAQTLTTAAQQAMSDLDKPIAKPMSPLPPTPASLGAGIKMVEPTVPAPTAAADGSLVAKLSSLPEASTGLLNQLVHDLPNQGTNPLIERSNDGMGVIISANNQSEIDQRCFLADADLLRAGATAEDIIPLATSQWSANEATPLAPAA